MDPHTIKVLLVDDDQFAYEIIRTDLAQLEMPSFSVTWKGDYRSGMEALREGQADVCLLDYQLGDRSGLEFLREATAAGSPMPIVMLTGQSGHALDTDALRAGATDYIVKGELAPPLLARCLRYAVERWKTLEQLRESQERYALAVAGANDGLWDWAVTSNDLHLSTRWKAILGYVDEELRNTLDEWFARVHPEDVEKLKGALSAHVEGKSPHLENEHRLLHKDGTFRWVVVRGLAVRDRNGRATRIAGSLTDVTQSRGFDPLTGLPNRALFLDRLLRAFEHLKRRTDYAFAVLFLDVDRFKIVNDSLGHVAGDELLVNLARRLEGCVRRADTVARLGGDEFTLLLDDVKDPEDATRVAQRIHDDLAHPIKAGAREVFTTASIGIAIASQNYERAEDLLRDADTAMYRAKSRGRACHEMFDEEMHNRAVALLHAEMELRRAIDNWDFRVVYQPLVSMETGELSGFEALVRWAHPTRGLVAPGEFIELAEETGLIVQLDRGVMQEACARFRSWQDRFPAARRMAISVNMSKRQFTQTDFLESVDRILALSGLSPESLNLEITESVIIDNADRAMALLKELRDRRISLVMDDFGTGYSSLSYLQRLPFSAIKVDRSFVRGICEDSESFEIVRAIVSLARTLKMRVTAEGVETQEQLGRLRGLCDRAQGYLFSRPLEEQDAETLLVEQRSWPT